MGFVEEIFGGFVNGLGYDFVALKIPAEFSTVEIKPFKVELILGFAITKQ